MSYTSVLESVHQWLKSFFLYIDFYNAKIYPVHTQSAKSKNQGALFGAAKKMNQVNENNPKSKIRRQHQQQVRNESAKDVDTKYYSKFFSLVAVMIIIPWLERLIYNIISQPTM